MDRSDTKQDATTVARLVTLERRTLSLTRGILLLALVVFCGSALLVTEYLNPLGVQKHGASFSSGGASVLLRSEAPSADGGDVAAVALKDASGTLRGLLSFGRESDPRLSLLDSHGELRVAVGCDDTSASLMLIGAGKAVIKVKVSDEKSSIDIVGPDGKIVWSAP